MKQKLFIVSIAFFVMGISSMAVAEMSSANYRVTTTVVSGGGGPMESANYQFNGTVGQPSPLIDPLEPPISENYDLYPGFWYTSIGPKCGCDLNLDGTCNGLDWLKFFPDWGRTDCNVPETEPCECDLNSDGSCNGLDWLSFYPDWGRTDCLLP